MKLIHFLLLFALSTLIFSTISVNGSFDFTNENDMELNIFPADNYADEIITEMSFFYTDGEKALGAPDGEYAKIFEYYSYGSIIFDLGRYEICSNSTGDDLRVYINKGTYIIKIGNNLSSPFTTLGQSNTTNEFDIDSVGFTEVRYIQIFTASEFTLELDAIEVINLYTVITDNDNPIVEGPEDYWVYDNVSKIPLTWAVSDATPWNYSIFVNDTEIASAEWYDISISFDWTDITVGILNIKLILYDFFGNSAEDTVIVEIRALPTQENLFYLMLFLPLLILVYIKKIRRKN
ncbi:MAG: hypothetical protein ACTSO5_03515 [Candidatus Heimdallarchaeaceae archaeon]